MRFDQFRTEAVYNTRAVVQRTGVPADTFRAWERRYGVPSPCRTAGNQRLYSERDIARIGWLRDQTQAGLTISQAIALMRSEEARQAVNAASSAAPRQPDSAARLSDASPLTVARDRLVDALVSFDGIGADRVVEEAIVFASVEDVCVDLLQNALIDVGDRWQRGELSVGAEHFASNFVMRKIAALFNLSQPQHGRGPIIAACVEGERHEIGLMLTSLFLSRAGYQILYLGASLPLADLLETIAAVEPDLVLLSATREDTVPSLVETARAIRAPHPRRSGPPPTVGYGGQVFVSRPELREGIDGTFLGRNARETVESIKGIEAAAVA